MVIAPKPTAYSQYKQMVLLRIKRPLAAAAVATALAACGADILTAQRPAGKGETETATEHDETWQCLGLDELKAWVTHRWPYEFMYVSDAVAILRVAVVGNGEPPWLVLRATEPSTCGEGKLRWALVGWGQAMPEEVGQYFSKTIDIYNTQQHHSDAIDLSQPIMWNFEAQVWLPRPEQGCSAWEIFKMNMCPQKTCVKATQFDLDLREVPASLGLPADEATATAFGAALEQWFADGADLSTPCSE